MLVNKFYCVCFTFMCDVPLQSVKSKHQHSVAYSQPFESLLEPSTFWFDAQHQFPMPDGCHGKYGGCLHLCFTVMI